LVVQTAMKGKSEVGEKVSTRSNSVQGKGQERGREVTSPGNAGMEEGPNQGKKVGQGMGKTADGSQDGDLVGGKPCKLTDREHLTQAKSKKK